MAGIQKSQQFSQSAITLQLMLNGPSEVTRALSHLTWLCGLVSATVSTWSEVYLHMKEREILVPPTDPLIKRILRQVAMHSLMEVGIRYPGIKHNCTDITSATQETVAEEWNNWETLAQELCPDSSHEPRSQCSDLSEFHMNGGFPLAWTDLVLRTCVKLWAYKHTQKNGKDQMSVYF